MILCYHGVALDDEDRWCPLYVRPELLRRRLELIRDAGCSVLPLGEAVERLYRQTLPPRSVVITFDDGFYDFYKQAAPILREFDVPATVYFTTYYASYNVPVFDPACWYVLWKGAGRVFEWPDAGIDRVELNEWNCRQIAERIKAWCLRRRLSGSEKNDVLRALAERVGVDFGEMCDRRLLHIMNPAEAAQLAREGFDFQLHCHRHRVYRSRARFQQELMDNRTAIERMTGQVATHFCYPGGRYLPEFPQWLAEIGIQSATTTNLDLASPEAERYLLPRLLDINAISEDEFSAWLSGIAHFVPRPQVPAAEGQLVEEDDHRAAA